MKLLFYIRQARGSERVVVKHPHYIIEDDSDEEVTAAFFDTSSMQAQAQAFTARRLDDIIEGLKTTLPHVQITMEMADKAPSGSEDGDIYTYLRCVEVSGKRRVFCAFSSFERLPIKSQILRDIFDTIATGTKPAMAILNVEEITSVKMCW